MILLQGEFIDPVELKNIFFEGKAVHTSWIIPNLEGGDNQIYRGDNQISNSRKCIAHILQL